MRELRYCPCKSGVGEAETKGIVDPISSTGNGLKIAVTHINIVGILYIIIRFMEISRRGIVLQLFGKGIHQLAAGIAVAAQQLSSGSATLHAALPGHQHRADGIIGIEPLGIHHATDVHHNNDFGKVFLYLFHHRPLSIGQVEIAILKQLVTLQMSIPALTGETGDGNNRCVGKCSGLAAQCVWQLRLRELARQTAFVILFLHIGTVIVRQILKDIHMAVHFLQAFVEIDDVFHGHITATATAFDIVKGTLAKQGQLGSLGKGQQPSLIFQQHHTFLGSIF